jgi:hypothetical protein
MKICGKFLWAAVFVSALLGCGDKKVVNTIDDRTSPTYQGPSEEAYCSNVAVYFNPVTITGTAAYQFRLPFGATFFTGGLGAIESTTKPIRRAEVRALNSAGTVIQCGETDANGNFTLDLPKNTGTYTVEVNSRAFNSFARVTVFNKPEFNEFYSISVSVGSAVSASVGTMTALATTAANVIAGAFNILDQIVEANIFLRANVTSGNCPTFGCTAFTVAPKVNAYWEVGFNPGTYVGNSSGLSFYIPGYSRLFILGGINGNTTSADTDHFDNSMILHEYGHFLEDQVFVSDSPGGAHDGQSIIDPRLAWSEGWGNFFQAAVLNDPRYIDTSGNTDGTTRYLFLVDLEDNSNPSYDEPLSGADNAKGFGTSGEGNFREFSVTRLLWDSIDSVVDAESISNGFVEMWSVLTNSTTGWMASKWRFQDVGLFHKLQNEMAGRTDWASLRTLEKQVASRKEYAQYLAPDAGCAPANEIVTLTPGQITGNPSIDFFRDYDFYHLSLGATTSGSITLEYADINGVLTSAKADLDIRLLDSDGRINNSNDIVSENINPNASSSIGVAETTTLTLSSVPAGNYLLQVFVWNGQGDPVRYNLKLNGVKLCQRDP